MTEPKHGDRVSITLEGVYLRKDDAGGHYLREDSTGLSTYIGDVAIKEIKVIPPVFNVGDKVEVTRQKYPHAYLGKYLKYKEDRWICYQGQDKDSVYREYDILSSEYHKITE